MKSITFLMPGSGLRPSGGYKVVYEYANRLVNDNIEVHIVYPSSTQYNKLSLVQKVRAIARYLYWMVQSIFLKKWFNLDTNVKKHYILSLDYSNVPKTDYYVATAVSTAYALKDFNIDLKRCLYLIQGFENWGVTDEYVKNSYKFGFSNIVISDWLARKVDETKAPYIIIKNGFDFDYFHLSIPIEKKNKLSISMLYHDNSRKGCVYGIEALNIVKDKFPELKAVFFGTPSRPSNLPDWIDYFKKPDKVTHNKIYNESAIYLAPSIQEGWGLTVGEAMIGGAAIVCTDTLGFQEMVEDGKSALISPIKDSQSLADNIIRLIENDELRMRLAKFGHDEIQKFTWEKSYLSFKSKLSDTPNNSKI